MGLTGLGSGCRYGEQSTPFCVSVLDSCPRGDREFSRRIHDAVERASLEVQSGSSSDEEEVSRDKSFSSTSSAPCPAPASTEPKTIPTVSNPNSVYRVSRLRTSCPSAPARPGDSHCSLLSTVQRVLPWSAPDLAERQAEGLRGGLPASWPHCWRSTFPVPHPERLQVLQSHLHLHRASR